MPGRLYLDENRRLTIRLDNGVPGITQDAFGELVYDPSVANSRVTIDAWGYPVLALDYVYLNWPDATDTDFSHYNVYRSTTSGFAIAPANLLATDVLASEYYDVQANLDNVYFYRYTVVDQSGLESAASTETSSAGGGAVELSGAISGAGTATGSVAVSRQLSGSVSGAGTLVGSASVARELLGGVAGAGTYFATPTVQRLVSGALSGAGSVAGSLEVARLLSGGVSGSGRYAGLASVERLLSGAVSGAGSVAASLLVERLLSGLLRGEGLYDGELFYAGPAPVELEGSLSGAGRFSGDPEVMRLLSASIAGAGSLAGYAEVVKALSGAIAGSGGALGSVEVERLLSGALVGQGLVSGEIAAPPGIAAAPDVEVWMQAIAVAGVALEAIAEAEAQLLR